MTNRPAVSMKGERMPTRNLDLKRLRVLVVEDDEDIRAISLLLLNGSNAHALGVADVRAAEAALAANEIDVIVTDMVMPEFTGRQFLDWLLAHHPEIPVVAISGVPVQLDAARRKANVRGTLDKPFDASALLDAVLSATS